MYQLVSQFLHFADLTRRGVWNIIIRFPYNISFKVQRNQTILYVIVYRIELPYKLCSLWGNLGTNQLRTQIHTYTNWIHSSTSC